MGTRLFRPTGNDAPELTAGDMWFKLRPIGMRYESFFRINESATVETELDTPSNTVNFMAWL